TRIGNYAFNNCSGLTNITLPSGVTDIGNGAFNHCDGLTGRLTIPAGVTNIGSSAFSYCSGLTGLTFSAGVTTIGDSAFSYCEGLTGSITIPAEVTYIGGSAFWYCSGLTGITIPAGVTYIGSYAFRFCSGMTAFDVDDLNSAYCSVDGVLYNKTRTRLIQCPGGKTGGLVVPDSVTGIADWAFNDCDGLTGVTIPSGVTSIPDYTFNDCDRLTSFTVDAHNSSYCSADGALYNKTRTRLIQCPGGKTGGLVIPNSVTNIGNFAFHFCSGLISITVDSLNSAYSSLDGVLYNKAQTLLIQCPGGKTGGLVVPDSVTGIRDEAFRNCDGLTSVTIPAGVTNIGIGAFHVCDGLKSITVDDLNPVYSSVDGILYDKTLTRLIQCPGGKTGGLVIPNSVTNIGNLAFRECSGLTTITIPAGVTRIGNDAFYNCSGLTGVYFLGDAPAHGILMFGNSPATVYRVSDTAGWPAVPTSWAGRPTALWNTDSGRAAAVLPAL
ncbi:MAG: leucine-rich repeat domain-containing protein, partial [Pontiellaceae bacterium]|nr:leucine-rich repeat domain-containing protein [Pontiellaceae bacterium]